MTSVGDKSRTKIIKNLTIDEILYLNIIKDKDKSKYEKEIKLYRDIFHFIFQGKTGTNVRTVNRHGITYIDCFSIWPLCSWLLDNNREYKIKYENSTTRRSSRPTHLIKDIALRLERLIKLFLLHKKGGNSKRKKDQKGNKYYINRAGLMVALALEKNNCNKKPERYQKLMRLALDKQFEVIDENYKSQDNYYYYFMEYMLNKCLSRYSGILENVFAYTISHSFGLTINFSELRFNINNEFFKKIINDDDFKLLFYNTLDNFKTPSIPKLSQHNSRNKKLFEIEQIKAHEARQMIKAYFKLDVETQIDREFSDFLKNKIALNKSTPDTDKQIKCFDSEELIETDVVLCEIVEQPHHMVDYKMRNKWDKERINNLLNSNKITLVVNCTECRQIYPYLFDIEKDWLKEIPCLYCKKHSLKYYDMKNELDKLFLPGENILRFK